MKSLIFNNETFKAEKIIKTDIGIFGKDISGNLMFSFKGISDFELFTITNQDGTNADFDTTEASINDLQTQIFKLTSQLVSGGVL